MLARCCQGLAFHFGGYRQIAYQSVGDDITYKLLPLTGNNFHLPILLFLSKCQDFKKETYCTFVLYFTRLGVYFLLIFLLTAVEIYAINLVVKGSSLQVTLSSLD